MRLHFVIFFVLLVVSMKAQVFKYEIDNNVFHANSYRGIQIIDHGAEGYIIYVAAVNYPRENNDKIYKLDLKFNITDSIILPFLKQNTVQHFFKSNQGIAWYYDYYNSDSTARFYEVAQLTFQKETNKKIVIGKIENWQSNLSEIAGCTMGFSCDQKLVYCYLWKEKSKIEHVWISQLTLFDLNLNVINKTVLEENIANGPFWARNTVLQRDTTFYTVIPQFSSTKVQPVIPIRPKAVTGLILHSFHLPSNEDHDFTVEGINQGMNNSRLIFDDKGKLHYVGFFTIKNDFHAKGFFDYLVTDKNELILLNKHLFTSIELKNLKIKNYKLIKLSGKEYGLNQNYEIQKVLTIPGGMYEYVIEDMRIIVKTVPLGLPTGRGFLAGAILGTASFYLDSYAINNPELLFNPVLIFRKSFLADTSDFLVFPISQKSQKVNFIGIYQFEYLGNHFIVSNENKKNAKRTIDKWDYYSTFANKGRACITAIDNQNCLKRTNTYPSINGIPAIISINQITRLDEKTFLIIVKSEAASKEYYFGKLIIED